MDTIEELLGLLQQQTEINTKLVRSQQDDLIDSNIAKSPGGSTFGNKVSPKLSGPEMRRVNETSNIFIKNFFDAKKKYGSDKKEKTLVSNLQQKSEKARDRQSGLGAPKSESSWLSKLLTALGLGAFLKKLTPAFFRGLFTKILGKLGSLVKGISKAILSLWKKVTNSKFFKAIGNAIKSAMRGIGRAFSKIVSSFKSFFGFIAKKLKGIWSAIRGSKAFKAVGKAFSSAIKAIGSFFTGLKNKLLAVLNAAKEFAKKLIPAGAKEFIGKSAVKAASVAGSVAGKAGGFWNSAKNIGSRAISGVKAGASAVGNTVVAAGSKAKNVVVRGAKAVGNMALTPAKAAIRSASAGIIAGSGGMFKMMGKLAKVPVIGPLLETALTVYDIKSLKEKHAKGELTLDQLQSQSGKRVIQGVSALGGGALGTFLGAAAGSIIPVAGTAIGGVLGAISGDALGRFVGGLINDYIMPPKYSKTIGAYVTGTPPPKEMQDFIIRGNNVMPFSNKDEIMGMKRGGAIDDFLSARQENAGMGILLKTSNLANMYLAGIERNTREMIKALGGRAPNVTVVNSQPASSGGSERPTASVGDNRLGYSASPYALA